MIGQDSSPRLIINLSVMHACMYALGDIIQFMWLLTYYRRDRVLVLG